MGLHAPEPLIHGPSWGPLFETACLAEMIKLPGLSAAPPAAGFFRTATGLEVDLVLEDGARVEGIELKGATTLVPPHREC